MFTFHLIDESNVRVILNWRDEPPYDFYNNLEEDTSVQHLLHPQNNFYKIVDENTELVGYCSGASNSWGSTPTELAIHDKKVSNH